MWPMMEAFKVICFSKVVTQSSQKSSHHHFLKILCRLKSVYPGEFSEECATKFRRNNQKSIRAREPSLRIDSLSLSLNGGADRFWRDKHDQSVFVFTTPLVIAFRTPRNFFKKQFVPLARWGTVHQRMAVNLRAETQLLVLPEERPWRWASLIRWEPRSKTFNIFSRIHFYDCAFFQIYQICGHTSALHLAVFHTIMQRIADCLQSFADFEGAPRNVQNVRWANVNIHRVRENAADL